MLFLKIDVLFLVLKRKFNIDTSDTTYIAELSFVVPIDILHSICFVAFVRLRM